MRKLTKEEIARIVKAETGGAYRVVQHPAAADEDASHKAEASAPDPDALRRKYFGDGWRTARPPAGGHGGSSAAPDARSGGATAGAAGRTGNGDEVGDEADDAIVDVVPTHARDDGDESGATPKAVVISGKTRRIIGAQG
jgi:hypothetical protein